MRRSSKDYRQNAGAHDWWCTFWCAVSRDSLCPYQSIVTAMLPRAVLFVGATALHAVIFVGMYALLGLRAFPPPLAESGGQALGNAAIGVVAFSVIEAVPGFMERRRRTGRLRR